MLKTLFDTRSKVPRPDVLNEAGGWAHALEPRHALAQLAATGTLGHAYYTDAELQLDQLLRVAAQVEPAFVARCAVYARQSGFMKDVPVVLLASLALKEPALAALVFDRVVDNGRQLRALVQVLRSGVLGRRAIPRPVRRLIRDWIARRPAERLLGDSIGQQPSLADVVKMVHPRPATPERAALLAYLIGKPHDASLLPPVVRELEAFKASRRSTGASGAAPGAVPDVPFRLLTALELSTADWTAIACRAPWTTTRINLNTFLRHGVFDDAATVELIADRLRDPEQIRRARAFPYQLLAAYLNVDAGAPRPIKDALHDAMEVAIDNVPVIDGAVAVCPDVSGSMGMSVTGFRKGATSKVTCHHVSALVAAALLRRNPDALVLPFDGSVRKVRLEPRDTVMTNAQKVAAVGGGATCVSAPIERLVQQKKPVDLVVVVSDNQSWVETATGGSGRGGTATMKAWERLRKLNPKARLVCIDIAPYATTQAPDRDDVLNVGGFGDEVFRVLAEFAAGRLSSAHWVGEVDQVRLPVEPDAPPTS